MRAQLVCRARPGTTLTFVLAADESVLGRDPGLTASVPLDGVSRRHAKITWDGRCHWLEDLGSTNGTFLNGRPVRRERLRHLDVITLGKKVDLVFALRGVSEELHEERKQGIRSAALHLPGGEGEVYEIPSGEVTLGRSSACNVELDSGAVSTVHARIERRLTQLVIEDLGSSNGTFVNGVRTSTTLLHDGDVISLGGVVDLRVQIELGEVTGVSVLRSRADWLPAATGRQARSQFGSEWRTRMEWGSGELRELGVLRDGAPAPASRQAKPEPGPRLTASVPAVASAHHGAAPAPVPKLAAPKPAAPVAVPKIEAPAPVRPLAPAAPKPATPKVEAAAPARPVVPAASTAAPKVEAPVHAPPQVSAAPPAVAAPAPVAPPPVPAPAAQRVEAPAPPAPGVIRELCLRGAGFDLALSEPGAHQIGRAPESALRLDHPTVSRRHARVILSEDRSTAYLQDMGGANGTQLNGVAVDKLARLAEGDRIRVGEVELVVALRRS